MMTESASKLSFVAHLRPPVRRVLAVDAGSRCLKLLLAESDFGRLRLLREDRLDLQAEGLVSPEEIRNHLGKWLEECGNPPLGVVLPQHLSISQVIDLPEAPESEVDKLIGEETLKLGGVTDSRIVYDFVRAERAPAGRQQFWVTLCQESNIRELLLRLGLEHEDISEITTTDNALITAYRTCAPRTSRSILVHLGAQTTVVVVLVEGQAAFATSFQMGGDFFTRALARLESCPFETAEARKRKVNLLSGPEASAEFAGVVDGWVAELKRQLSEWFQQNRAVSSDQPPFELVASGGGFDQPGLIEHLRTKADLPFQPWPRPVQPDSAAPGKGFEIAFGMALQALEYAPRPVSLLPEDYRVVARKRLTRQRIELVSLGLVCLCVLLLALGTWRKVSLIHAKTALWQKVQAGQRAVDENDSFSATLLAEYENLRPVFAAQQNTVDTLKTLSLLQQSRTNRELWYVLLADQQSYFSQPPALLLTNRPARSNLLGATLEFPRLTMSPFRPPPPAMTNVAAAKPGFIAELCVPGNAEQARRVVSDVVNGLTKAPIFAKVDLLSDDLRRNLADPKVTVPDRQFTLALDFAATEFQQPAGARRPGAGTRKRPFRPAWAPPEQAETVTRSFP